MKFIKKKVWGKGGMVVSGMVDGSLLVNLRLFINNKWNLGYYEDKTTTSHRHTILYYSTRFL